MFEKYAIAFADKIKKINPDETEPHDVLVFGFTIIFNLIFTTLMIIIISGLLSVFSLTMQIVISFMIVRLLTGGAHLDHSLSCSIASIVFLISFCWMPISPLLMNIYFISTILLLLLFAPYYEAHQLQHSKQWEQKKKIVALLWVIFSFLFYYLFALPGFILGAFLQALFVTPIGVRFTHKLNKLFPSGGDFHENNS